MALGYAALYRLSSGEKNVAVGSNLDEVTTGTGNVGIGFIAGRAITTGSNNTYIGTQADGSSGTVTNEIAIGYNADGQGTNSVVLGNSFITKTILQGNVGIGTSSPSAKLHTVGTTDGTALTIQDADGTCTTNPESASISFSCTSDQRVKTNIREAERVLPYIMGIPIKQYNLIDNYESHTGVIAQELLNNYPELVTMGQDSLYKVSTISHWKVIKAIQEQQTIIESQATKIQNLESTIQTQQQQIQDLINRITAIENQ